jgi:hypothetical protein
MKKGIFRTAILGLFAFSAIFASGQNKDFKNTNPTPYQLPSQMQTHLRLEVKDDTKELRIIQTDNDPDIVTKAYVLKNMDPYELRPYLKVSVGAERIKGDRTKVECIKYNDGTGIILVSAESYRFGKQANGMGFDEMIEKLDIPKMTSSSGTISYIYFPKYHDASWLATRMKNVGLNVANDIELQGGKDKVIVDHGLNALLFYLPPYSVKNVKKILPIYDTPIPEVKVKYTVYELDYENDGTVGVDFQAWKNGPGSDLFASSYRYTNGWDIANSVVGNPDMNATTTQFFKFSPRWNTKFLDFLAAKGKANVVTSGELSIMNNQEGRIENTTKIAGFKDGAKFADIDTFSYFRLTDARVYNANSENFTADDNGRNLGRYRFLGTLTDGTEVTVSLQANAVSAGAAGGDAPYRGDFLLTRVFDGNRYYYSAELDESMARAQGVTFIKRRRDDGGVQDFEVMGYKIDYLTSVKLDKSASFVQGVDNITTNEVVYYYQWDSFTISWATDFNSKIFRDVARDTSVNGYGFILSMIPSVCDETTIVDMHMTNTSLIGFTDNGSPRTSKSEIQNKFMINNKGGRLVVGGIDKQAVVRSVAKLPYLGDIPALGWIFSSESEVTKKSQVVTVLDCVAVMPNTAISDDVKKNISELKTKLTNSGESNSYGFDQLGLDEEKEGFDPLP